jgi:hypothetical protein
MAREPQKTDEELAAEAAQVVDNEKPRYRVIEKSFIGHTLHEAGAEITHEGDVVADNLSPLNDAAQAVVDAQSEPHVDKTDPKAKAAHRTPRRQADAAAAGVDAEDDNDLG